MKLPFDQNLSFKLCERLADLFPGSGQVGQLGLAEADDSAVWQYAGEHGLVLVSLDADFAEMGGFEGPAPEADLAALRNQPTDVVDKLLRDRANAIAAFERDDAACLEIY